MAAVTIPMVMLVAPGVGGYLGRMLDQSAGTHPFGLVGGIALGLVAAVIRIRKILQTLSGGSGEPGEKK